MELPQRKRTRLQGYDYGQICRGGALLRPIGMIAENEIRHLSQRFHVLIEKYVSMPNHIHLIVVIERAEQSPAPTVNDIVCAFKSITTKIANRQDNTFGRKIWQRSFHDHIIRNEAD